MLLQKGRTYLRRDGLSICRIVHKDRTGKYPFWDHHNYQYNETGQIDQSKLQYKNSKHPMDLIKEYTPFQCRTASSTER